MRRDLPTTSVSSVLALSESGGEFVSLAGSVGFRSHLHSGQRVATEYTIRPKATHLVLVQALIVEPRKWLVRRLPSADSTTTIDYRSRMFSGSSN